MPQRDQPGKPYPPLLSKLTFSALSKNAWILELHGLPRKEALQVALDHQRRQARIKRLARIAKRRDANEGGTIHSKMNTPPNTRTTFS